MDILEKIGNTGIVPVVVLDDVDNAVPTAKALLAGGIDIMEITFRTSAAASSINEVSQNCPDILVGAGTVITLDQCKEAVSCGAQFIVTPGLDTDVATWCVENGITVLPGCVTPSEIITAKKLGINVIKFFPANIYGGLSGLKALSGPFGDIKFVPTGGVNLDNIQTYASAPFVQAVGGSWLCTKDDIKEGNFDRITQLCVQSIEKIMGFEVVHVGLNCEDSYKSMQICNQLEYLFGWKTKEGNSSNFAGASLEIMKTKYLGDNGHIAVATNSISRAVEMLKKRGATILEETAKRKNGRIVAVYLEGEYSGFAFHLVQR